MVRKIVVRELPGVGWEIVQNEKGLTFPVRTIQTAADALRLIQKEAQEIANETGKDVVIIEWYPKTRIGKMVVNALQK